MRVHPLGQGNGCHAVEIADGTILHARHPWGLMGRAGRAYPSSPSVWPFTASHLPEMRCPKKRRLALPNGSYPCTPIHRHNAPHAGAELNEKLSQTAKLHGSALSHSSSIPQPHPGKADDSRHQRGCSEPRWPRGPSCDEIGRTLPEQRGPC